VFDKICDLDAPRSGHREIKLALFIWFGEKINRTCVEVSLDD
jgi:hypothetical protein